jgi:hypothetical protein
MNNDLELKLQAYIDGELPADQIRTVEMLLADDPASRRLVHDLQGIRGLLKTHQSEAQLPVPGAFYWSQIQRQITAQPVPRPNSNYLITNRLWLKWLFPVGLTALLAIGLLRLSPSQPQRIIPDEMESQLKDATFFSFRSQEDGFSVVWVDTQAERSMTAVDDDFYY